mmetsp:Transcript_9167/g.11443  ORF Transcript_9167/g.11443 Transcript_9167/m.11443 type:complete len:396 (+) Transcript_9167:372-1559(+)
MLKQKVYKWKDTNLALIGSDLDKQARLDSAETEKAWDGCGTKPELKVWRIEQFKVKHWPESKYGQFHEGDSYIVLHTYKDSEEKQKLLYDIHFWIGAESTQDEYGTAAYKTVELDAKFNDAAVQHREVQGHESPEFKKLFNGKIAYLEGGVESGFNHVGEPESKAPELFRVKGTKNAIEFVPVKCRRDYMNSGDVFILDTWLKIYQWNGKGSNPNEKLKAGGYLDSVVSSRGGECTKEVLEEGQETDEFWALIPGAFQVGCMTLAKYDVKAEGAHGDDENVKAFRKVLYRLSDSSGNLKFSRVSKADISKGNRVAKDKLKTEDVYILDDGFMIWVWIGKGASRGERGMGMSYAMKYIKKYGRPTYMPITQIKEGSEPLTFTESLHNDPSGNCSIM